MIKFLNLSVCMLGYFRIIGICLQQMEVIGYWNFNFNLSWFFRLCRLISAGMFSNLYSTGPFVGLTLPFMIRPFLIRYDQLSTMKKRMEPKILSSMNNYNLHLLLTFLLKRL